MVECRCPFLMGFFGAEQHNCVSYLLTEYMPGGDIKALMDMRKTLPIVEVRSYTLTTSFMPTIYALCMHCVCTVYALCVCTVYTLYMHCTGALLFRVRHVRSGRDAC